METLKYKVIISEKQYDNYCMKLEELAFQPIRTKQVKEEIDLLTLLIEKWDEQHPIFEMMDPVQIIKSLMEDHNMNTTTLAMLLKVSKGLVSDILHYKKGLSKETIRILSEHFKLNQEVFNRQYKLKAPIRRRVRKTITA